MTAIDHAHVWIVHDPRARVLKVVSSWFVETKWKCKWCDTERIACQEVVPPTEKNSVEVWR